MQMAGVLTTKKETIHGRDCFRFFYKRLKPFYTNRLNEKNKNLNPYYVINDSYQELFQVYQKDLGHYFRNLYNLIKFVHNSDVKDKHVYTNIIRAQLSSHELLMLFYNSISNYGNEKFKPLIENYHLLKNISFGELLDQDTKYSTNVEIHKALYAESAYKDPNPKKVAHNSNEVIA
jgi:hypothetical protein